MGGICNPPVIGSGVLPIIGGGPDRILYENAAQLLDTDADFLFTGAPVAPDFNNMQIPLGGGLYLKAANGLLHWNNASGLTNTGTDSLTIGGGQWQSLNGYNFSFTGATVMNMSTSTLTFTNGGATNAAQLTAAGDWWFGTSDPGGAQKVRINGALFVSQNTGTSITVGASVTTGSATPALLNMGGTFGNNAVGASGNLKLALYHASAAGDFYGLGLSSGVVEYQCSNAAAATGQAHSFYRNGVYLGGSLTTDWIFGASDPGGADKVRINGALTINSAVMIQTKTAFTDGAAAAAGTLLNAPAAGNPTKWIPVNDNGTTRYIPAW